MQMPSQPRRRCAAFGFCMDDMYAYLSVIAAGAAEGWSPPSVHGKAIQCSRSRLPPRDALTPLHTCEGAAAGSRRGSSGRGAAGTGSVLAGAAGRAPFRQ